MDQLEIALADGDRVTLRVGDVVLRIDADQRCTDVDVVAMAIAAGAALRRLHGVPFSPGPGRSRGTLASGKAGDCGWRIAARVLPADVVGRQRPPTEPPFRPWTSVFTRRGTRAAPRARGARVVVVRSAWRRRLSPR